MTTRTSMLHIRIDNELKIQASKQLAGFGLTVSDAVRMLLTRVVKEGALPADLTADPAAYDAWFRQKVREALGELVSCDFASACDGRGPNLDRQEELCPHW